MNITYFAVTVLAVLVAQKSASASEENDIKCRKTLLDFERSLRKLKTVDKLEKWLTTPILHTFVWEAKSEIRAKFSIKQPQLNDIALDMFEQNASRERDTYANLLITHKHSINFKNEAARLVDDTDDDDDDGVDGDYDEYDDDDMFPKTFRIAFFKQCRRSTGIIDSMIEAFERKKKAGESTTPIYQFAPESNWDFDARREHFTRAVMVNYFQLELDVRYHSKMRLLYEERSKNLVTLIEARDIIDSPRSDIKIQELKKLQPMWTNYLDLFK